MLDLKDKKLLFEIDFDARKTDSELARALRMSKRGVDYKLESLEKKKVILGYYPVIDLSKLGYYYFRVFVRFQNLSSKLKRRVEHYVLTSKIGWFIWYNGSYDAGFTVWAKSLSAFKKTISDFYSSFDSSIIEYRESIGISVDFLKQRFLLKKQERTFLRITEPKGETLLDETDRALLEGLVATPRATLVHLAEKIKEDPKKISYRLKRLYKKEILLGIRPSLNYSLLGKIYCKVFFYFNKTSDLRLEEFIRKDFRSVYVVKALGTCDLDVEFMMDSAKEVYSFIELLHEEFPGLIKNYEVMMLGETAKTLFLPGSDCL